MMKNFSKIFIISGLVFASLLVSGLFHPLLAYVMQSTNYKIQADDSLTATGGEWSSANYVFKDTMGEVSTGLSDSTSYKLKAGYQEMLESYLSVSIPDDVSLAPPIPGITGGTASANVVWRVIADNSAGFDMDIKVSTAPAMKLPPDGTSYFDDYSTTPSYAWSVASDNAKFGFTVEPATAEDTVLAFLDNNSDTCGTGSTNNTDTCWSGFNGTTNISAIHRTTRTGVSGENETVKFQAQSNGKFMAEGDYKATVTVLVASN
jgi:hypothetical protein